MYVKRQKNYKIICFVLVLTILLAGISYEAVAADALFWYAFRQEPACGLSFCRLDVNDAAICTTEMLRSYDGTEVRELSQAQGQRREVRASVLLLYTELFSLLHKKIFTYSENVQFFCHTQKEPVMDFMHRSDGKKRI